MGKLISLGELISLNEGSIKPQQSHSVIHKVMVRAAVFLGHPERRGGTALAPVLRAVQEPHPTDVMSTRQRPPSAVRVLGAAVLCRGGLCCPTLCSQARALGCILLARRSRAVEAALPGVHRLLSAFLTRLSCPSVCPRPLCSGSVLPALGGPVGSVNGYHTCKGESAVPARVCWGRVLSVVSVPAGSAVHFHP